VQDTSNKLVHIRDVIAVFRSVQEALTDQFAAGILEIRGQRLRNLACRQLLLLEDKSF
jgi:hypothetical protein